MRLSNLPDNVTNKDIEDQSADACELCNGETFITGIDRASGEIKCVECDHCDGSGIEPKRFHDQEREDSAFNGDDA